MKRFDVDLSGRIEFGNGEFLGVIATIAVTSIHDIDDFVFSAAFRTFDHVCIESVLRHIKKSTIVITNIMIFMGYCGELMMSFELQDADHFSCRMLIIVFAGC